MFHITSLKIDWHGHLSLNGVMKFEEGVNLLIGKNGSGKTLLLQKIEGVQRNQQVGLDPDASAKFPANSEMAKLTCKEEDGSISAAVYRSNGSVGIWENWQVLNEKTKLITSNRNVTLASTLNNPIPSIQKDISMTELGAEIDISLEFTQAIMKDLWEKIEQTSTNQDIAKDILDDYRKGLTDFEKEIKIDLKRPQNPIYFLDHRGKEVQINELSSGEKEYLYFYAFLRKVSDVENQIILIDEPELHLHSSQLRTLCELISNLAINNQIIIATHSGEILQNFITSNIVSLSRGKVTNIKSSIELKNALEEIGLPIDPSVFTSHWISAENDPSVSLKGKSSPLTPEVLSWVFGTDINKKFWSFGRNKENAESVAIGISKASTDPVPVNLSVILDGDKLVTSAVNFPPSIPEPSQALSYWPCWELENIFLMPEILDKLIKQSGRQPGSKMFWNEIQKKKKVLFLSILKTALKNFLKTYKSDKVIDKDPIKNFETFKETVSALNFDHKKLEKAFSEVVKTNNWRWLPGKEALSIAIGLNVNFWVDFSKLINSGEYKKILFEEPAFAKLINVVNNQTRS